jgi:hypothetical protein
MFYDAMLALSLPLIAFGVLASVYGILAYLFNWE